jgi:hypothetical protein
MDVIQNNLMNLISYQRSFISKTRFIDKLLRSYLKYITKNYYKLFQPFQIVAF